MFVTLWQKYIDQGMDQEEAYRKVDTEFQEVENKVNAGKEAEMLKQLRTFSVPAMNSWLQEEEKYVQEALDYHKNMFYARKKKTEEAEAAVEDEDAPVDKEAEKIMKKKTTRGKGKGKK